MDDKILELTGALIGLVRATDGKMKSIERVKEILTEGLFAVSGCMETLDETALNQVIERVHEGKAELVPGCIVCGAPCGRTDDYDMKKLQTDAEDIQKLKLKIKDALLISVKEVYIEGKDEPVDSAKLLNWSRALFSIGESWGLGELETVLKELKK